MSPTDIFTTLAAALAGGMATFFGTMGNRWLKRTPEAISPEKFALDTVKELRDQFSAERDARIASEASLSTEIKQLREEVRQYFRDQTELKRFIVLLEDDKARAGLPPRERSETVARIFSS